MLLYGVYWKSKGCDGIFIWVSEFGAGSHTTSTPEPLKKE